LKEVSLDVRSLVVGLVDDRRRFVIMETQLKPTTAFDRPI